MAQVLAGLVSKPLTDAQVGSPASLWPSSSRDAFRWEGAAGQVLLAVLGLEAAAGLLGMHRQQHCPHPVPTQGSHMIKPSSLGIRSQLVLASQPYLGFIFFKALSSD